jgi:hypothetical protein
VSGAAPPIVSAQPPEEKHPLSVLSGWGTSLDTGYLNPAIVLSDELKIYAITFRMAEGKYKVALTLDPNRKILDEFGDGKNTTKLPVKRIDATLKARNLNDPARQGRKLYDIEAEKLPSRLTIMVAPDVVAPPPAVPVYSLLVRDKDGKTEALYRLIFNQERAPPPPCHPGCFPAGTMVATPDGLRKIETIKPGEVVLNYPTTGKPTPIKVASVFAGQSLLVEIDTEAGKLITTGKQPLMLATGEIKGGANLVTGDTILRWQEGKIVSTKVRSVKALEKPENVFNLVLEKRGTFVANGYLVRSKPPAAE